ncbi:hypothetical protein QQS21_003263 [Conoideocrella luteorostrata]|uniref:Major facilitator superfamily (MFS) profile domain-containing protein n=1 Tax=Conoideocrella luteorostrata TaxID=1105319 RepID=A0AAJ0FVR1_9HYPO|nr:hypothetical protein QQS21_003263 [Conoideocrella luteorostrata]
MLRKVNQWGNHWRSKPIFTLATVTVCLFTDLFLYGLVIPVLPFLLRDRLHIPQNDVQSYTSGLLAAYSGASVLFSIPAGWAADKIGARKPPFMAGLVFLAVGTVLFAMGRSFALLLIARVLQGAAAAVVWTVGLATVQDTVGPAKMGQAVGTIFSITGTAELMAPAVGGMVYDAAGMRAIFGLSAGVLAIDLIMRLLLVDTRTTKAVQSNGSLDESEAEPRPVHVEAREQGQEDTPLLPKTSNTNGDEYKIQGEVGNIVKAFPVLYCLRDPRLLTAMLLCIVQGVLVGIFDATVALEVSVLFNFSAAKAGLTFTALIVPFIGFGPVAGMAVDKYGTKLVSISGYAFLVPCLAVLGIPSQHIVSGNGNVVLFCAILAFNGLGLAIIGSLSVVEASDVSRQYEAANPGFFGDNGPYAQVFGFNSLCLFAGLTIGPLIGGALRDRFGYEVMGLVFAAVSVVAVILSYCFIGKKK